MTETKTKITGKEIKQIMKDGKLSIEDIASQMEVSWATVNRWLKDVKPMSLAQQHLFAYLYLK